ncbi:GTP cyclohydrolase II RibA [Cohnella sp. CFH 77786]|uniref:GTP cyclohydrolase II n=1 Tax=Cohnella sp. CFH 77786 TaxID=2662265 RepID=UPI001C60FAF2|nr:GTP cyclohydrolase II [Cohnella sp. CFH 77786]MBW5446082.1 GTP cyclohydrolase II RibA [Cohnella sp. CFH 77786]
MMTDQINKMLAGKLAILKESGSPDLALVGPVRLPVQLEHQEVTFRWYSWVTLDKPGYRIEDILQSLPSANLSASQQSSVLVYGDFADADHSLVRMHSICHTGDIFGSKRCDCGYQLRRSLRMIADHGSGALFYLANHEGRGIGLFAKSLAYLLQEAGFDTVEANLQLGLPDDARSYEEAIRVLQSLRRKPVSLITNNPYKLQALREKGLAIDPHYPIWGDVSRHNARYLATKIEKSKHIYHAGTDNVKWG